MKITNDIVDKPKAFGRIACDKLSLSRAFCIIQHSSNAYSQISLYNWFISKCLDADLF
jgi:hypothetical protein